MRLHYVCFQQQFQGGQVCLLMLFQLLADKSLGQLKKAAKFNLAGKGQQGSVILCLKFDCAFIGDRPFDHFGDDEMGGIETGSF
jgi:hypothetical protein